MARWLQRLRELRYDLSGIFWSLPLRWCCVKCGKDVRIHGPLLLHVRGEVHIGDGFRVLSRYDNRVEFDVKATGRLTIGDYSGANQGTRIQCRKEVYIGSRCMIGPDCVIMDSSGHPVGRGRVHTEPVRIEDGVWLATRVIVLPGVTIGAGSVVSAGSVVTHSIRPNSIVAGVPARVIGTVDG